MACANFFVNKSIKIFGILFQSVKRVQKNAVVQRAKFDIVN